MERIGARVKERLDEVRARINATGVDLAAVRIVAVTKGFGEEEVVAASEAGLRDLGENYAAELIDKAAVASRLELGVDWHYLGAVQRNKVRRLAPVVTLWQGVSRLVEGREIARWSPGSSVFVQVDFLHRPGCAGCSPGEAPRLVDGLRNLGLDVRGLMTVGPGTAAEDARPVFRQLAAMAKRMSLAEVSMGMTEDLEVAVEEGATMLRLGRALFGCRPIKGDRGS